MTTTRRHLLKQLGTGGMVLSCIPSLAWPVALSPAANGVLFWLSEYGSENVWANKTVRSLSQTEHFDRVCLPIEKNGFIHARALREQILSLSGSRLMGALDDTQYVILGAIVRSMGARLLYEHSLGREFPELSKTFFAFDL